MVRSWLLDQPAAVILAFLLLSALGAGACLLLTIVTLRIFTMLHTMEREVRQLSTTMADRQARLLDQLLAVLTPSAFRMVGSTPVTPTNLGESYRITNLSDPSPSPAVMTLAERKLAEAAASARRQQFSDEIGALVRDNGMSDSYPDRPPEAMKRPGRHGQAPE